MYSDVLVTSPIVVNVPTRGLLAVETMHAIVQWLANLNIKRNMMAMFVMVCLSIVRPISMFWPQKEEQLTRKKGANVVSNRSDDQIFTFATQHFYRLR